MYVQELAPTHKWEFVSFRCQTILIISHPLANYIVTSWTFGQSWDYFVFASFLLIQVSLGNLPPKGFTILPIVEPDTWLHIIGNLILSHKTSTRSRGVAAFVPFRFFRASSEHFPTKRFKILHTLEDNHDTSDSTLAIQLYWIYEFTWPWPSI